MRRLHAHGAFWLWMSLLSSSIGQGFFNLDFEQATISPTPVREFGTGPVDPGLVFPGWTMGPDGIGYYNYTLYNTLTFGSVAQVLVGPSFPNALGLDPLQGQYSAFLQFGPMPEPGVDVGSPALIQTGLIPLDARSITFLVSETFNDARVTLDGVDIPLVTIEGGRLAGDVSFFAGRQAELMVTTTSYNGGGLYFDDLRFSAVAVPEPRPLCLSILALLSFQLIRFYWPNKSTQRIPVPHSVLHLHRWSRR